jgi:hypothetical protein
MHNVHHVEQNPTEISKLKNGIFCIQKKKKNRNKMQTK